MPHQRYVGVRGKAVQAQSREIIANVLKFMREEAAKGAPVIPITNFKKRVLQATGVSDKVYREVCRDMGLIEAGVITTYTAPARVSKLKSEIVQMQGIREEVMEIIVHE